MYSMLINYIIFFLQWVGNPEKVLLAKLNSVPPSPINNLSAPQVSRNFSLGLRSYIALSLAHFLYSQSSTSSSSKFP